MTKGIRRELSMEEEVIELDRMLMALVRRNLALAVRLSGKGGNEKANDLLKRYLSRHVLVPKEKSIPKDQVADQTEEGKRIRQFDRYLNALPDQELQNVLDLVKSMYRVQKPGGTWKARGKTEKGSEVAREGSGNSDSQGN
jgi:hypothetical protein